MILLGVIVFENGSRRWRRWRLGQVPAISLEEWRKLTGDERIALLGLER
jgi:hypothetical protein